MRVAEAYDYLTRARRDLREALAAAPAEALTREFLDRPELKSIRDLVLHIAVVSDCWLHEDILRTTPVLDQFPELRDLPDGARASLPVLLDYWSAVEASTQIYLNGANDEELAREMSPHDDPERRFTVDWLLWHVMIHEMRHTAQIAVLLRMAGVKPPSLDLLFYPPVR